MFSNMFQEKCFCTLEEIKVGSHEFSWKWKIVTDRFSWSLQGTEPKNIVIHGIWNPRACKWTHSPLEILKEHGSIME